MTRYKVYDIITFIRGGQNLSLIHISAKQAEEKKNEIIMYLAHDIRTPLTTCLLYTSRCV